MPDNERELLIQNFQAAKAALEAARKALAETEAGQAVKAAEGRLRRAKTMLKDAGHEIPADA